MAARQMELNTVSREQLSTILTAKLREERVVLYFSELKFASRRALSMKSLPKVEY